MIGCLFSKRPQYVKSAVCNIALQRIDPADASLGHNANISSSLRVLFLQ